MNQLKNSSHHHRHSIHSRPASEDPQQKRHSYVVNQNIDFERFDLERHSVRNLVQHYSKVCAVIDVMSLDLGQNRARLSSQGCAALRGPHRSGGSGRAVVSPPTEETARGDEEAARRVEHERA